MKRPKTARPERLDSKGRRIVPSSLRSDIYRTRKGLLDAMETMRVAHGNYGLGDYAAEYEALRAMALRFDDLCRTTTTTTNIANEQKYGY